MENHLDECVQDLPESPTEETTDEKRSFKSVPTDDDQDTETGGRQGAHCSSPTDENRKYRDVIRIGEMEPDALVSCRPDKNENNGMNGEKELPKISFPFIPFPSDAPSDTHILPNLEESDDIRGPIGQGGAIGPTQPTNLTQSIGAIFTGQKNVDIYILAQLDDDSLSRVCRVDQYAASLFRNEELWNQKTMKRCLNAEKFKIEDKMWREYYKELRRAKIRLAGDTGHLDVLKWLAEQNIFPDKYGVNWAVKNERFDILKWLEERNILPDKNDANDAAEVGNLNMLQWLAESPRNILPGRKGSSRAAEHGYLDVLKWLGKSPRNILPKKEGVNEAAQYGFLNVLKWVAKKIFSLLDKDVANHAAEGGQLETLEWLAKPPRNILPDKKGAKWAAWNGYLGTLKWLAESPRNIFPDKKGVDKASEYGHLNILKWLALNKIFPDEGGASMAVKEGHLEVLEWLEQYDILPEEESANIAAKNGHLEVLKWLEKYNILPDGDGAHWANESGHWEVLEWLRQRKIFA